MAEIRAAMSGQETWESYLWFVNGMRFLPDPYGNQTAPLFEINDDGAMVQTALTYKHRGFVNPAFTRAFQLKLPCPINRNITSILLGNINDIANFPINELIEIIPGKFTTPFDELYTLVKEFAEANYGKRIMVRLPDVNVAIDSDTLVRKYSMVPVNGGWLNNEEIADGIARNIFPAVYAPLLDENELIRPYVRYDSASQLDFSKVPQDAIMMQQNSVFIRCEVIEDLVFVNYATGLSPRAVLELPGPVYRKHDADYQRSVIYYFLLLLLQASTSVNDAALRAITSGYGDFNSSGYEPFSLLPAFAAIPLESNVDRYGPWYLSGAEGKTEFEQVDTLVPWQYGGFDKMLLVGEAMVSQSYSNLQWLESGTVEVP
jgi:hypothetical protein